MKRTPTQALQHPTVESFEEVVLQSDVPVLVDFWAPWCPPCMMLKPELEQLAADLGGRAKIALISVDEEPELADKFDVSSLPALMILKRGRRMDAWTGYAPRHSGADREARLTEDEGADDPLGIALTPSFRLKRQSSPSRSHGRTGRETVAAIERS